MLPEVEAFVKFKYIWIYGAGVVGKNVAKQFKQDEFKNRIQGVVVTNIGEAGRMEDYTVCGIDEVMTSPEETLFLIAVSAKYQSEIVMHIT